MAKKTEAEPLETDAGRRELGEEILGYILRPQGDPNAIVTRIYDRLAAEFMAPPAANAAVEGEEAA